MPRLRPLAVGAIALSAALLLTGCLDGGFPGATPTATPSAAPSTDASTPTPTSPPATPSPTPSAAPATPVALDCAALLSIEGVYAIDPNLAVIPLSGAPSTWLAQETAAAQGTVCEATHGTSGAVAFIGISAPGTAALDAARAAAGAGSPLGGTGLEVFGAPNQLQVFHDARRVTAECDPRFNPDSLRALLELALANGA